MPENWLSMCASLITPIVEQLLLLEYFLYYHFIHHENLVKMVMISNMSDKSGLRETASNEEEYHFPFCYC